MNGTAAGGVLTISVRVTPKASRTEIVGLEDDVLKVRLTAPPVDGAANAELVKVLAKFLGISKSQIQIASGTASRNKIVRVAGISHDDFMSCVNRHSR